ncbi:VanZ family protein [Propionivibrio limicola]|uniref:VanZ family protein n=1 Tax=Propionivibrio limicola TaxID=167645 RepID=UPI0012926D99|nr:VanZ family protein [Propionivibrio limicola]
MKSSSETSALPHYLALSYVVLIVYASLHPISGWRVPGVSSLLFLEAAWPRYWTVFDLAVNVFVYVPLGFLLSLSARRWLGRWLGALAGLLLAGSLSFSVEVLQSWLPSRVPSNLDLVCNSLGGILGAVLAIRHGERFFGQLAALQHRLLAPRPHNELGLVLTGLWLLIQLSPETLLFGAGDLRHVLPITPAVPYAAASFYVLEAGIVACNMVAIGLLVRELLAPRNQPHLVLLVFFFVALAVRTLGAAVLVGPASALAWLTPGARLGLPIGGFALALFVFLPPALRIALAGLAIMAGTVLVNLTPPNPYSEVALLAWRQGHFLNFNGLTRLAASLWPFVALPCLMLLGWRSGNGRG